MATWLQAVNSVQIRLREKQTASVTTTAYSTLLGEFVNQAKREIEDAWNWSFLRQNVNITTASGTSQYTLTGATKRSRLFGNREVYDDTNDTILKEVDDWFFDRVTYLGTTQSGNPIYFRFRGLSSGIKQIEMYPTPNGIFTVRFPMIIPQSSLSSDGTEITVPEDPVVLRAWALAVSERGEDGGSSYTEIDGMARDAKGDAISLDAAQTNELVWNAD